MVPDEASLLQYFIFISTECKQALVSRRVLSMSCQSYKKCLKLKAFHFYRRHSDATCFATNEKEVEGTDDEWVLLL